MSKKRKILLILGLVALLGVTTLSGLVYYFSANPSKLKHLAENALSGLTGAECSIREISFSRKPLIIQVKGIELRKTLQDFHLEIPKVSAAISVQGPFGRKSLIIEDLRVNGLAFKTAGAWSLPRIGGDAEKASPVRRILGRLVSFFLFKDITVQKAGLTDGHMSGRWHDRTITVNGLYANLTPERFLEAGCSVRILSLPDGIDLELPRLKWVTGHPVYPAGATLRATMKGEGIEFEAPQGKISRAALEADMIYHRQERTLEFELFRIVSDALTLHPEHESGVLSFPLLVEARGSLDLQKARLSVPSLHVGLGSMGEFKGKSHVDFNARQGFVIEAGDLRLIPWSVVPKLPGPMKKSLEEVEFTGPIHIRGRVAGNLDQRPGRWTCDLEARLGENGLSFASPGVRFNAALTGDLQIKGPFSGPELDVKLALDELRLRAGAVKVEKGRLGFSMTGVYPAFQVKEVSLHRTAASLDMGGKQILVDEIEGRNMGGSLDLSKKTFRLPDFALASKTLKNLLLSLELAEEGFSAALKGEDVRLLEFCRAMGFLPHGWTIGGTESLQAAVHLDKNKRLTSRGTLRVQDLSFESEDGDFLGEGLSLLLEPVFEGNLETGGKLRGAMSLSAREGELLYDRFYLDLSRHPLVLSGKGSRRAGSFEADELRIQLDDLAMVNVKGSFTQDRTRDSRFRIHVPRTPLAPIFRQFIVEPYKHQAPSLTKLHLEGFFSLDLELSANRTLRTVKGRTRWQEGHAALGGQEILLKGIDLDLPIWYHHSTTGMAGKAPSREAPVELEGSLFIESAQLPLLPVQPIGTRFKAGPDRLHTLSPIAMMTHGGHIEIGRILFTEPFSNAPKIETALTLNEIDLNPWLSAIWPKPVAGAARGKLDPVQWQGGVLTTRGEIAADLFEGKLIISNVGAKRFPSLTPVIALDAVWSDLDLAQMTGDTAFGKVQGNLTGHAKGLEIADGQPQAFDLLMETVKQRGTPQRISVQAVDNIARIGGGASPFSGLAGAFVSLFRELPYEKIGIRAVLENDLFRINGTIRENDKEYLIKKGGFSGVDVIIGSPGSNTISFKDMVRRIKRVTDSQEGPVIE